MARGRKPGSVTSTPMTERQARERVWRAMRMLRRFTIPDLAATAEAGANNVQHYLIALERADYVRVAAPRRSGVKGGHAVYVLARDTGPHAPRVRGDNTVADFNVQTEEGTHESDSGIDGSAVPAAREGAGGGEGDC